MIRGWLMAIRDGGYGIGDDTRMGSNGSRRRHRRN